MIIEHLNLPYEILAKLKENKNKIHKDFHHLIGHSGYNAPFESILYDAVVALAMGKNILLKGPTGSGKTKLAETLSSLFNQPMHMVNCSVDLDSESLLGFKTISAKDNNHIIEFVPGPVVNAMKNGHFLYIDEINMAKPETLPILNGVLDYRKMMTNPFTSEVIKAQSGFGVIAAINEGYVGTVPLNEALKNRFVVIHVPYIKGDNLKTVLKEQSKQNDENLLDLFVRFSSDLLFQVENGSLSEEAASIRALLDACDLSIYLPVKRAINRSITEKLEDEREKAMITNIAESLF